MFTLLSVKTFKAITLVAVDGLYTVSMEAQVFLTGSLGKKKYFYIFCIKCYIPLSFYLFKSLINKQFKTVKIMDSSLPTKLRQGTVK